MADYKYKISLNHDFKFTVQKCFFVDGKEIEYKENMFYVEGIPTIYNNAMRLCNFNGEIKVAFFETKEEAKKAIDYILQKEKNETEFIKNNPPEYYP